MTKITATKIANQGNSAPRRLMIAVVCVLCLCLLGGAFITFKTLSRMRTEYLSNRGHEIAATLENQARGAGRRNNPEFWQSLFEENYETYSGKVAYLALVDQSGNLLAGKGKFLRGPLQPAAVGDEDIFRFEELLGRSRNRQAVAHPSVAGWRIQIGLYAADADFIKRTAFIQLALSGMAIVGLSALLIYLLRMLDRFMEMKSRENEEAQLKSLGIMAASLAHEIRNPLGAIKGLTQLAQEELSPDDAAQARLRTVVSEAERLETLVASLLDFASPKEPNLLEFDITDLLVDVKTMLQPRLEESGIDLSFSGDRSPLRVRSDPAGLRQVLLNVLFNAMDASPAGSSVILKTIRDESKEFLVFQIDDAGPGLGGRDPQEFFQPFVTTKARGTGLGLAISRRIIEKLGGTIALENNPPGGSRCSIRLPLASGSAG